MRFPIMIRYLLWAEPCWADIAWLVYTTLTLWSADVHLRKFSVGRVSISVWSLPSGLVQDCSNSIANALELLQSCTKSLNYSSYHSYLSISTSLIDHRRCNVAFIEPMHCDKQLNTIFLVDLWAQRPVSIPHKMLYDKITQSLKSTRSVQWNLSVTTTSIIRFITCNLFSNVF